MELFGALNRRDSLDDHRCVAAAWQIELQIEFLEARVEFIIGRRARQLRDFNPACPFSFGEKRPAHSPNLHFGQRDSFFFHNGGHDAGPTTLWPGNKIVPGAFIATLSRSHRESGMPRSLHFSDELSALRAHVSEEPLIHVLVKRDDGGVAVAGVGNASRRV